jgi:diacylglycerol kinase family enzyme
MKVTLIHNPKAGDLDSPKPEALVALIHSAGHHVIYQSVKEEHWHTVLGEPTDLVVAAGGDGTVRDVVQKVVARPTRIAILPTGTANNIGRALGVADTPLQQLIAGWASAHRVKFDVPVVRSPQSEEIFIEAIGIGIFSRVMAALEDKSQLERSRLLNDTWKELLASYRAKPVRITLDRGDVSDQYILVEAMNIKQIGSGLRFAPDADPGDGLVDVVLVAEQDRVKLADYVVACLEGKSSFFNLVVRRAKELRIEWEGLDGHLDDEFWPSRGKDFDSAPIVIDVAVNRRALEFLVPPSNRSGYVEPT